jgi:hypothetical protein
MNDLYGSEMYMMTTIQTAEIEFIKTVACMEVRYG